MCITHLLAIYYQLMFSVKTRAILTIQTDDYVSDDYVALTFHHVYIPQERNGKSINSFLQMNTINQFARAGVLFDSQRAQKRNIFE